MKHHVTETHENNFETHNVVLSAQRISLSALSVSAAGTWVTFGAQITDEVS